MTLHVHIFFIVATMPPGSAGSDFSAVSLSHSLGVGAHTSRIGQHDHLMSEYFFLLPARRHMYCNTLSARYHVDEEKTPGKGCAEWVTIKVMAIKVLRLWRTITNGDIDATTICFLFAWCALRSRYL